MLLIFTLVSLNAQVPMEMVFARQASVLVIACAACVNLCGYAIIVETVRKQRTSS